MKAVIFSLLISLSSVASLASDVTVFKNADGCVVEVEQAANGYRIYIKDGYGQQAFLGVLKDFSSGDIAGFCSPAVAGLENDVLTLSCENREEAGSYTTRGYARVVFTGGVSSVVVKGQVKKIFGWKTDTNIVCSNLRSF